MQYMHLDEFWSAMSQFTVTVNLNCYVFEKIAQLQAKCISPFDGAAISPRRWCLVELRFLQRKLHYTWILIISIIFRFFIKSSICKYSPITISKSEFFGIRVQKCYCMKSRKKNYYHLLIVASKLTFSGNHIIKLLSSQKLLIFREEPASKH